MSRHQIFPVALLCAASLVACGKDAVREITGPVPGARIKFFNFSVNAPGVNFYANDRKMTAISSATGQESVLGTGYGEPGAGGFYTALPPGQYELSGRIAAATDKDLKIATQTATLSDGKNYSFYQSGFYDAATKTADTFLIEDKLPTQLDYSYAYVRFVDAISNANPMILFAKSTTSAGEFVLSGAVGYKSAGEFVSLPSGFYDLSTRYPGASGKAIARAGVSFVGGTIYTVTARGDITVTSTTATNRPFLDATANR